MMKFALIVIQFVQTADCVVNVRFCKSPSFLVASHWSGH